MTSVFSSVFSREKIAVLDSQLSQLASREYFFDVLRYLSVVRTTRSSIGIFLMRASEDPEFNDRQPTRTQKFLELESEC